MVLEGQPAGGHGSDLQTQPKNSTPCRYDTIDQCHALDMDTPQLCLVCLLAAVQTRPEQAHVDRARRSAINISWAPIGCSLATFTLIFARGGALLPVHLACFGVHYRRQNNLQAHLRFHVLLAEVSGLLRETAARRQCRLSCLQLWRCIVQSDCPTLQLDLHPCLPLCT